MNKTALLLIFFIPINFIAISQVIDSTITNHNISDEEKSERSYIKHYVDIGVGIGLDYGGVFGLKLTGLPVPNFGFFGIIGINFVSLAWNIGAVWNILPSTSQYHFRPNIKLMYGIHATTRVSMSNFDANWVNYDKSFKGFTPGIGLEIMPGKKKRNGLDIDLSIPIHSEDFKDQVEKMKNDPNVEEYLKSWPVTVSIGYHHEF
jgi:hypothetical protein